jgi:hypothetical protein
MVQEALSMSAYPRAVNFDVLLKDRQPSRIEFWHDNGDGTCTRLSDGLTLPQAQIIQNDWPPAHTGPQNTGSNHIS